MNRLLLNFAIMDAACCSLLPSSVRLAQVSPSSPKTSRVRITQGPEVELSREFLTIIRWTSNNPGSPLHYGVVRYGLDPKNLTQTAKISDQAEPGAVPGRMPSAARGRLWMGGTSLRRRITTRPGTS